MGDRGLRPDNVRGHFQGVWKGGGGLEPEPSYRGRIAAHDDDSAEMFEGVAAPVPHVEGMDAVVGVRGPVQVDVPLVFGELLLVAAFDLDRVGGIGQDLFKEVDVARVVNRVKPQGVG